MKKLNLILCLIIASTILQAQDQEIVFSNLPEDAIKQSEKIIQKFFKAHNNNEDITNYFTPGEANYGGALWLGIDEFKEMISQLMPKPVDDFEFEYCTIDDLEYNTKIKEKAVKLSRVFNNYSILADGTINDFDASIVLNVQNGEMRIYSIVLWHINLFEKGTKKLIPTDTLFTEKIALVIPEGFRDPVFEDNFTSFILPGSTKRDAVIQVMSNQKVADLNIYTYMWADHISSAYRRSDFEISYINEGYMIKYEIIDENDIVNQGITVGIEHNNQLILIQYFGFKETYNEQWAAIDEMMRNIVKL